MTINEKLTQFSELVKKNRKIPKKEIPEKLEVLADIVLLGAELLEMPVPGSKRQRLKQKYAAALLETARCFRRAGHFPAAANLKDFFNFHAGQAVARTVR